jgi:hypothetical protein
MSSASRNPPSRRARPLEIAGAVEHFRRQDPERIDLPARESALVIQLALADRLK